MSPRVRRSSTRQLGFCLALLVASCSRATPGSAPAPGASASARPPDATAFDASPVDAAIEHDEDADPLEREAEHQWDRGYRGNIVYVPTPRKVADHMLAVAKVGSGDLLYDLGCGDGRIVVAAATRYGAHAVGFDMDPERVEEARNNVRLAGVESLVTIRRANLFSVDLSPATVVTMYLHPRIDARLLPKLEALRPGTRIVSHDFDLRDRTVRARPDGRWMLMAPFFGNRNELFDAGAPEDPAHYTLDPHWVYLWTAPLKLEPLPKDARDEFTQASTQYEKYLAREDMRKRLREGHGTAADVWALVAECRQQETPEECSAEAAEYQAELRGKP